MAKLKSEIEVQCPCCSALLVIDTNLGRVVSHKAPERGDKPELNEASRILAEEERRAKRSSSSRLQPRRRAVTRCRGASRKR